MKQLVKKLIGKLGKQPKLQSGAQDSRVQKFREAIDAGNIELARVLDRGLARENFCSTGLLVLKGRLAYALNDLQEAEKRLREALELEPLLAEAHRWIAMTYMRLGAASQALAHATTAERIAPGDPEIRVIVGVIRYQQNDYAAARQAFASALEVDDHNADAHRNLGVLCFKQDDWESAARHFKRFSELNPESAFGWASYASSLVDLGREDEAWPFFARAVALAGLSSDPYRDYGAALFNAGHVAEARAQIGAGLAIAPANALLHVARANCNLIEYGSLPDAWAEYEWRLQLNARRYAERTRRWDGTACGGKTLLVYAEQGMGDVLMFARYISRLKGLAGRIALQVPPALTRLLRASAARFEWDIATWVEGTGRAEPSEVTYELEIPLLSLMHTCRFPVEKATLPYLAIEEDLRESWARRLGPRQNGRPRVGLVWAGNPARREDGLRSIRPEQLAPLGALNDVDFVSLQLEAKPVYLNSPLPVPVIDLTSGIRDFADTAAIMLNLDLVLSIDTAAAHLAGALGVPCWVLLSKIPDWRWQMGGVEQPWYGNHRSFVVERQRDWLPLVERVATQLSQRKGM